jgi:hypothetical protein
MTRAAKFWQAWLGSIKVEVKKKTPPTAGIFLLHSPLE